MKKSLLIFTLLFLAGCGYRTTVIDGKPGYSSLIETNKTHVDSSICKSGSGLVVNIGLDLNRDDILNSSEIEQTQVICDGANGVDGQDATSNFFISKVHDPCGDYPGEADEVLLELEDGSFVAWYTKLGLTVLEYGVNYRTTDKQKCKFKIDVNGQVVEL